MKSPPTCYGQRALLRSVPLVADEIPHQTSHHAECVTYALAPDFFRTSLPGLEWPVFVMLRQNQLESDLPALTWDVLSAIAIAAISILAVTLLFLKLLLRPVERLALAAKNIANGTYVALKASNSSREASSLSSAIAVIQDKLLPKSDEDRSNAKTH